MYFASQAMTGHKNLPTNQRTNGPNHRGYQLETGRIWDYASDVFVHRRLVQTAAMGRFELALPAPAVEEASSSSKAGGVEKWGCWVRCFFCPVFEGSSQRVLNYLVIACLVKKCILVTSLNLFDNLLFWLEIHLPLGALKAFTAQASCGFELPKFSGDAVVAYHWGSWPWLMGYNKHLM